MERRDAERIVRLLQSAIGELHDSIVIAQTALTEAEYEIFKRGAGMSIAKISYECLDRTYTEYPDLARRASYEGPFFRKAHPTNRWTGALVAPFSS